MAFDLYYSPGASDRAYHLNRILRYALEKHYWHDTGYHCSDYFDADHIPMLKQIDTEVSNSDTKSNIRRLISAIGRHGYIKVWMDM